MENEVCERCKPFFEKLLKKIELLENHIKELEKKLKAYENAHTPSSQSRRKYPKQEPSRNKVGAQKGHKGTTRPQKKPDKIIDITQKDCPNCEGKLNDSIATKKRIVEDTPEPQPITVTQYNQAVYECEQCGSIVVAEHPDLPDEGRFGYNLMSEVVLLKYEDRLPLRKIAKNLNRRYGLDLTAATVQELLLRATRKCEPKYEKLKQEVKESKQVNVDETGQKVQRKKWWNWVFTTLKSVVFFLTNTRGQQPIRTILGKNYKGIATCDGWKPYTIIKLIQRCWAHLLRESKWLMQQKKRYAKRFYRMLRQLFDKIKQLREIKMTKKERMQEKIQLEQELESLVEWGRSYEITKPLANKIANGKNHWFTCVLYPWIEPTNNRAEQELREFVVQRKITGTLRNEKGTHTMEVLLSLLQTWKLRRLNPQNMMKQTLRS
ncbi:MAG: IS66 family transposase [Nanoarchaeota archaeon]|nr:IS66 family transposase [Nanoarchaeota archaeon]